MNYKDVIESRYNRKNWLLLLRDIFGSRAKFWNAPYVVETNSQMARQALWLGTISLSDEQTIAIYEVELAESVDIERNRRGIRDMLLTQWRNNGNAGAFMFCYRENESVLRFSYVSESWKFADDGTYQKESTDTRRFTYLLGEGHRSRTAIQQFETLKGSAQTLKDLTKAFSVDAVSDMFFKDYKEQYADIIFYITGKRMVKKGNKWEEVKEGRACRKILDEFSDFADPEKAVRDYVKKLMGRLVFLQFLQKKGWLGVPLNEDWGNGDHEFIQNLFANTKDKDNFIDDVLEVLFNDLNTERKNDISQFSLFDYQFKTPYLNGGLFERDATDETRFPLPAKYMEDMLEFFSRYNFTIDENDPNDAEVGVDPEMLGRIFENLLEDNKDKGAFYTPKEIVQYMCRESLIAYLQTDVKDESTKEAIRQFVTTHEVEHLGDNKKLAEQVDESLRNVKICDPAIGSGAFPMGLLKELYLCSSAIEGLDDDNASEIKKHIIQHNIYGVDIEKGAVDIARLRFWLSLIVDEKTPHALPNLDFKIMQGNSLLEQYKGVDLSAMTQEKNERGKNYQTTMFDDMLDVYRRELREMLGEYYQCTDHKEKKTLRKRIIDNVKKQLKEQSINIDFGDLDLSGNDQFFLWHTWFHDVFSQGGFDIVIGNPPYGAHISKQDKILYRKVFPETQFKIDTYSLFVLLSIEQMKSKGITYYILPNTLLDNYYEENVRRKILEANQLVEVCDLSDRVFESAVVHSMIIGYKRWHENKYNVIIKTETVDGPPSYIPYNYFTEQDQCSISYRNYEFQDLFDKLSERSVKLQTVLDIKQTIKTGNDKLYITREKLADNFKPILRGKDICRYGYTYSGLYVNYGKHLANCIKYDIFEQPKILIREAGATIVATYDDNDYYIMSSLYNAISKDENFSLKYLLGLINSKIFQFYMDKITFEKTKGAFTKARIFHYYALPVKKANAKEQAGLIKLVNKAIFEKKVDIKKDISDIETEIDIFIYHLYNLTYDEVLIIDPETPITREEYEKEQ